MRKSVALVFASVSSVFVEAGRIGRRDVTVTEIVTQYSTVCPCTAYMPTTSLGYPVSSSNAVVVSVSSSSAAQQPTTASTTTTTTTTTTTSPPAASTASSSSAPAATQSISAASLGDYRTTVLTLHNLHRRNHTASDLTWSDQQANTAAQIASSCVYAHNTSANGGGYGQNIGAGFAPNQIGFMLTNAMYDGEMPKYPTPYGNDNPDLTNFGQWGHFSQIVWASTTQVGCATQYCPNGLANTGSGVPPYFTVCNYSPPGNYLGEFSNVHAPRGDPTIVIY